VNVTEDSMMMELKSVKLVDIDVILVKKKNTTVSSVKKEEVQLQNVDVQMDSSMMENLLNVNHVPTNVNGVPDPLKTVPNVTTKTTEKEPQTVTVNSLKDIMKSKELPHVQNVEKTVKNVQLPINVKNVI